MVYILNSICQLVYHYKNCSMHYSDTSFPLRIFAMLFFVKLQTIQRMIFGRHVNIIKGRNSLIQFEGTFYVQSTTGSKWLPATSVNMADPQTKDSKKLNEFISKVDEIESLVRQTYWYFTRFYVYMECLANRKDKADVLSLLKTDL